MATINLLPSRHLLTMLLFGVVTVFMTGRLSAQEPVPRLLSYQGVLSDSRRIAVPDGDYTVTFRIYGSETGTTQLWEETNRVTTFDGVFETILGSGTPLNLPFDQAYWLGLQLQGEPEMGPRVRFVSTPYAMQAFVAGNAMQLDPNATGVVHTLNTLDGNLLLIGEGRASIRTAGDTLAVVVPQELPANARDGQIIRWNSALNTWVAVDASISVSPRLSGDGSPGTPLDIARMGATDGQHLIWDNAQGSWRPGDGGARTEAPLKGTGTSADPIGLRPGTSDRQVMVWDAASSTWITAEQSVIAAEEISGRGTSAAPLRLAQQGATNGQVLRWDATAGGWRPGPSLTTATPPLRGIGSPDDPLRFIDGTNPGQLIYWGGTGWKMTVARTPQEGEMLRWNSTLQVWEPAGLIVNDIAPLSPGSIWYGNIASKATELAIGRENQVLVVGSGGSAPAWSSTLNVDSISARAARVSGQMSVGGDLNTGGNINATGNINTGGNLTVTGTSTFTGASTFTGISTFNGDLVANDSAAFNGPSTFNGISTVNGDLIVNNPATFNNTSTFNGISTVNGDLIVNDSAAFNGPVRFAQFPDIGLQENALVVGDVNDRAATFPSTNEQGALLQQNGTGAPTWSRDLNVDSVNARTIVTNADLTVGGNLSVSGSVDLPNGSVDNNELANSSINLSYGTGVGGDAAVALGGTLNLQNTGVTSVTGTANQVNVNQATGDVTLSLPQAIHTDAQPQFDGVILDNLTNASTSDTILVSNGGTVQTRTVASIAAAIGGQFWTVSGNGGTSPGTHFLGTTDAQPFQIHVDNANATPTNGRGRVMRYEPNATSANIIGGFSGNTVAAGVVGATISGGGQNGSVNSISAPFATIGGGHGNSIGAGSDIGTIGGGNGNIIQGTVLRATISGGLNNVINTGSLRSTIGGGENNVINANAFNVTISGGLNNSVGAGSYQTTISGGAVNQVGTNSRDVVISGGGINWVGNSSQWGVIGGGYRNYIRDNAAQSTIAGGVQDTIYDNSGNSFIGGGTFNSIAANSSTSVITGGSSNKIGASAATSTIAGGSGNTINSTTSVIGGGDNAFIGTNARWSAINGGHNNRIADNAFESTIGAGEGNDIGASSVRGTVGGGSFNDIGANAGNSTISGGYGNAINTGSDRSTIGGGMSNAINSGIGTIAGGFQNIIDASAANVTIGGGSSNRGASAAATIAGGESNFVASGSTRGTIGGGFRNYIASGAGSSTIVGGESDTINSSQSTVGGVGNVIGTNSTQSTISGGASNRIGNTSAGSTISGGINNTISDNTRLSAIAGGRGLTIGGRGSFGFLGGNDVGTRNMTVTTNDVAVFGNTDLWLANNDNAPSQIRFYEAYNTAGAYPGTANYSSFEAQTQTADIRYILPDTAGIVGDVLKVQAITGSMVTLDWATSTVVSSAWERTGNAGTTPGTHFLGTTDAQAFQIHVDNANTTGTDGRGRVMRFEPNATSANIIGGYSGNTVAGGVTGAIIAGGGQSTQVNSIAANSGFIGGGTANLIESGATHGTIAGGTRHEIRTNATNATIVGGTNNEIQATASNGTVGGGENNVIGANAQWGTIAGGRGNTMSGIAASILAGQANNINSGAAYATIGGGLQNTISSGAQRSAIVGGALNTIGPNVVGGAIGGGEDNVVNASYGAVLGGRGLTLSGQNSFGFLGNNAANTRPMSVSDANVGVIGNNDLWLANNDNAASQIRFYEAYNTSGAFPNTANHSSFEAQAQTADIRYILPDTAGIVGDLLAVRTVAGTTVTLDWAASSGGAAGWNLTGNAGTTPGTNFVGTTDAQAFQIHVDNGNATGTDGRGRVMRYEPNATSANIIGGFSGNSVSAGITTATIAGGGVNGGANSIASNTSTVGGGSSNTIGASSINSTIAGGRSNQVGASAGNGTVSGGLGNVIVSGDHATINGGFNNRINTGSFGASIGGGTNNTTASHTTVLGGGNGNTIGTSSQFAVIGGGHQNAIANSAFESTIAGGTVDTIETGATYSTIGGGSNNIIRSSSTRSVIAGGYDNTISANADRATIAGGEDNVVSGARSAIAGGRGLTLSGSGSFGFLGANTGVNDMTVSASDVAAFGNTDLWLANNDNAASQLRFYEANGTPGAFPVPGTTHYTSFQAQAQAADINYLLPGTAGGVGDQLTISAIAGTQVTLGWAAPSDRQIKSDILTLDGEDILGRFRGLELGSWRYTNDPSGRRHYGIMAQDFKRLFGRDELGEIGTDTTVNNLDLIGVSYLAIQGLEKRTQDDRNALEELKQLVRTLKEEVDLLREENNYLRKQVE